METKGLVALGISLASPETIKSWSHGEVLKPETINYRRLRPEKDGLFCEAIFGPTRDWQCYCGKYKNPRYKGIVCDKCGVEVTRSSVRRERLGHIELATPIAHIWYTRRIPSYLGLLLDISRRNLDRVLYFAQYIVTYVDEEKRQEQLSKLEGDFNETEHERAEQINEKILQVKVDRDQKLKRIDDRRDALMAQLDEDFAERIAPFMSEAQNLEHTLSELRDQPAPSDYHFNSLGVLIVSHGDIVTNEHIARVQALMTDKSNRLEKEIKAPLKAEIEKLDLEKQKIRLEADEQREALYAEMENQSDETNNENAKLREELEELQPFTFLSEANYRELKSHWGNVFKADMGAEAFYDILRRLDLDQLSEDLWNEVRTTKSKQKRKKATSRLKVVESFRQSGNHPEWMILTVLPVIPPDLRPMVQLDGGRFATSDLNDLYRRVINRNNRLKRLLELGAPDVIVRNEKRMLQEAVDSLIDNSQRGKALSRRGRRELKSLSDMLKGKKGRFRRNLLGKRVDYSGRSVIIVGPKLKLYQCGLPKTMALELYMPFVISRLVEKGYATNVKGARRIIERNKPEVWEVLSQVIGERPVMLNRAPTLHRLGIQAFEPILIEGSAIQLHPLVCTAFNADFDGDQMAVHVPLSKSAVAEARELMLASKNLLKPADGEPIISPGKDMVLGIFYLTMTMKGSHPGDGRAFYDFDEVKYCYDMGQVKLHTNIKFRCKTWYDDDGKRMSEPVEKIIDTTVGRVIFNNILPEKMLYKNMTFGKGEIKDLIGEVYDVCGQEDTTILADSIKDIGFEYCMRSGLTMAVSDITVPDARKELIAAAEDEEAKIKKQYRRGLLTTQERDNQIVEIWQNTTSAVSKAVRTNMDPEGDMAIMANSGATKGGFGPIGQLAGMRGLMADPSGRIITLPIKSNFRGGLTALEYFISTHGARKGLADTALRTADAGYLTRRLVDIAQDLIINSDDCGTTDGIWIRRKDDVAKQSYRERVYGRVTAERVIDTQTGEIICEKGDLIDHEIAKKIQEAHVEEIKVRSPMTCELKHGICAKCYGLDLGRNKLAEMGAAVGTVAAQSIGEPGTQLTLRTFHSGGVAQGSGDITTGLPRVEELFEARRTPKGEAIITEIDGQAYIEQNEKYNDVRTVRVENVELMNDTYTIEEGWEIIPSDEAEVMMGDLIAMNGHSEITAAHAGHVRIEDNKVIVAYEVKQTAEYDIPATSRLKITDGQMVTAGQPLTEGSQNPHNILKLRGRDECQMYILKEIQEVYRTQGQNINDKHFEVIIRKMLGKVQIVSAGDTPFLPADVVDRLVLKDINRKLEEEGKTPAKYVDVLLGVTKASLSTDSWLSASSFQHTIKVLASAAIGGMRDPLYGLKENVIIGKLIPAGSGFVPGRFEQAEAAVGDQAATISNLPTD